MADGEVGEDALEDLITMLADRFPSVVGERRDGRMVETSKHTNKDKQAEEIN